MNNIPSEIEKDEYEEYLSICSKINYCEDVIKNLESLRNGFCNKYKKFSYFTEENFDLLINEYKRSYTILSLAKENLLRKMKK